MVKGSGRKKIVQWYYSRRAKDYDGQKSRTWRAPRGFGDNVLDRLLEAMLTIEGGSVLEVGIGSGRNALPVLEAVNVQLTGVDLSREMLEQAKVKLHEYRENCALVLGDAEHMPFAANTFDGIICMSTMHYFSRQGSMIRKLWRALRDGGLLAYGDLTVHECDNEGFFEGLERTVSEAHARYKKPSDVKRYLDDCGFREPRLATFAYGKSFQSLVEDKGQYFGVPPKALEEYVRSASTASRKLYNLTSTELTLYYTIAIVRKQSRG